MAKQTKTKPGRKCDTCNGSGEDNGDTCQTCGGNGYEIRVDDEPLCEVCGLKVTRWKTGGPVHAYCIWERVKNL